MEETKASLDQLEGLTVELERMRSITRRHSLGELSAAQLPRDVHTYYGRIQEAESELARYGFSNRKEGRMPEEKQDINARTAAAERAIIEEIVVPRAAELASEWRTITAASAAEAGAATNYFRGRADEWNATRDAIVRSHPDLEKDLPAAIQVDEIRVRQQAIQQEQEEVRSLAIAR